MNIRLLVATLSVAGVLANAQVRPADQAAPDEIGGNYRTWTIRGTEDARSIPTEGGAESRRRISEIATGMNYWDGQA